MTLYRHQVCKQADLILGMVLGGEEVPVERKRRAFDYYEPITTHDSTLSASTFSILASEVGYTDKALRFFQDAAFVDVDDRHGNTDHGVHMASLAGSWLALVWGFAGFRPLGERIAFRPILPEGWDGYRFGLCWRGTDLMVAVGPSGVTYAAVAGPGIVFAHGDTEISIEAGGSWSGRARRMTFPARSTPSRSISTVCSPTPPAHIIAPGNALPTRFRSRSTSTPMKRSRASIAWAAWR